MSTTPQTDAPADGGPTGSRPGLPAPLTRGRDGRWLAGVCAGIARHRNLPARSVRTAFGLAALVGGVGVLAYLACWLIIPAEGDDEPGTRGIVVLAQACAACVGLATLAAVGSAATIFGFGWGVLAIAAVILVAALAGWPRVGVGWALLPVAALALPALSMSIGGVRLAPETRNVAIAPQSVAEIPGAGYSSGLGSLVVDLRHTTFPATGNVALRIDAGIRRTIVALPANRCVYVDLDYDVVPFAARVASALTGRVTPYSGVTLFGDIQGSRAGEDGNVPSPTPGSPILHIYFHSAGGSLYVRDYADDVDPQSQPDWPGYPVTLEPRPDVAGTPRAAARRLIDGWLLRRRVQSASAAAVDRLLPGPCGASGSQPAGGAPARAIPAEGPYSLPPYQPVNGSYETGGTAPPAPTAPSAPTTPSVGGRSTGSARARVGGSAGSPTTAHAGRKATGSASATRSAAARAKRSAGTKAARAKHPAGTKAARSSSSGGRGGR
jgi:phage shock protein PspC (stress-responsive transcriptional regulator)